MSTSKTELSIYETYYVLGSNELERWPWGKYRLAQALLVQGFRHYRGGFLANARMYLQLSMLMQDGSNDAVTWANTNQSIGCVLRSERDFPKAIDAFECAQEHYEKVDHHLGIARTWTNLARTHYKTRDFKKAFYSLSRARSFCSDRDEHQLGDIKLWKGWCYFRQGKLSDAAEYAEQIINSNVSKPLLVEGHLLRGHVYLQHNQVDNAKSCFQIAHQITDAAAVKNEMFVISFDTIIESTDRRIIGAAQRFREWAVGLECLDRPFQK